MTHLLDMLRQSGESAQTDGMTYPVSCVENSSTVCSNHIGFLAMTFRKPFAAWDFSFASIHLQETFRQLSELIYKYVAFSSFDEGNRYKFVHASFVNQHFSFCRATYPTLTAPGSTTFTYTQTPIHDLLWYVGIMFDKTLRRALFWKHGLDSRVRLAVFFDIACVDKEKSKYSCRFAAKAGRLLSN